MKEQPRFDPVSKKRTNYQNLTFRAMMIALLHDDEVKEIHDRELNRRHPLDTWGIWEQYFQDKREWEAFWMKEATESFKNHEKSKFEQQLWPIVSRARLKLEPRGANTEEFQTADFYYMRLYHLVDQFVRDGGLMWKRAGIKQGGMKL